MNKEFSVAFISEKLKREYEVLEEGRYEDKRLYSSIREAISELKSNPLCGTKIAKRLWPKDYVRRYVITNLWKKDLPGAWRIIYTIESDEVRVVSIILEWFDHKSYEKRFGY